MTDAYWYRVTYDLRPNGDLGRVWVDGALVFASADASEVRVRMQVYNDSCIEQQKGIRCDFGACCAFYHADVPGVDLGITCPECNVGHLRLVMVRE